jgi:catechol 1,2-dioxygenase
MQNITFDNITETVVASLGKHKAINERQRTIMTSLIKHAHAFCKEVNLTHAEFMEGCMYLMRAGKMCDEKRQEFILLGDILGIEVLADMLTNPVRGSESVSTVLGPFYRENSPVLPQGASTVQKHFENEQTVYVEGHVRDVDGAPIANVTIDVWEDAPNGLYEQQDPDQPEYNLRGRFETDANGHYAFRAIRPMPYPIPYDGTAGELLDFMGHHPWRPGHIHFMLFKDGYRTLISQVYDADSPYLTEDSVFAVKSSLVGKFEKAGSGSDTDLALRFDFVLPRQAMAMAAE